MNIDNPHIETVISSRLKRGGGTDNDPIRRVLQHHTLDGDFLMESDEWHTQQATDLALRHATTAIERDNLKKRIEQADREYVRVCEALNQKSEIISRLQKRIHALTTKKPK